MSEKETLRQIWLEKGMTLAQVARLANISDTTLAAMNSGRKVSSVTVQRVCTALEISLEHFYACVVPEQKEKEINHEL